MYVYKVYVRAQTFAQPKVAWSPRRCLHVDALSKLTAAGRLGPMQRVQWTLNHGEGSQTLDLIAVSVRHDSHSGRCLDLLQAGIEDRV